MNGGAIAIIGGLAAAACWTVTTLSSAEASRLIGARLTIAWVMGIGLLIIAPFVVASPVALDARSAGWLLLVGAGNVLGLGLEYAGMRIGRVGVVAPIASAEGAVAAIFSALAGEAIAPGVGLALGLIAVGVVLAAGLDPSSAPQPVAARPGALGAASAGSGAASAASGPAGSGAVCASAATGPAGSGVRSAAAVPHESGAVFAAAMPAGSGAASAAAVPAESGAVFAAAMPAGSGAASGAAADAAPADQRTARLVPALLGLGAAVAFGTTLFAAGQVSAELPLAWVILPARLVGSVAVAAPLLAARRLRISRRAVPFVVASGIAEVVGFAAYTIGSRYGIAVTSVLASEFAAVAAVAAWLLFGERLSRVQQAGVAAIAVGVAALAVLRA